MHHLFSTLLGLCLATSVALPLDGADASAAPSPTCLVFSEDGAELLLALSDPGLHSLVVGIDDRAGTSWVFVRHARRASGGAEAFVWSGVYAFPTALWAHSSVQVGFSVGELD